MANKGKEMKQVHGRADEINGLDDLFPVFKEKSSIKAKSDEEYRSQLERMVASDLQTHALENHGIIPFDITSKQNRKRMIDLCAKEFTKKNAAKVRHGQKSSNYSKNAQRSSAAIFKNWGL